MKQLWAPWRMEYIQNHDDGPDAGCIFCVRDLVGEDSSRLILYRGEVAFVMMNRFPYSNGHLLVVPYRHTADPTALAEDEILEMHRLQNLCCRILGQAFAPQGYNIGMNLGAAAGAGVTDHLHLHVVPRWQGDTNFMAVHADVRVIPQHLQTTYAVLQDICRSHCP